MRMFPQKFSRALRYRSDFVTAQNIADHEAGQLEYSVGAMAKGAMRRQETRASLLKSSLACYLS